jgi:hypothetical protein
MISAMSHEPADGMITTARHTASKKTELHRQQSILI